ncbi:MAG: hypothetical protein U0K71_04270, partial [Paludibacteraceae bacterium]|nr:hypothetical protein [Paludibacteraceae bacterium]
EAEKTLTMMANEETGKYNKELKGKSVKFVGVVKENRITKEMIAAEEAKQAQAESEKKSCCSGKAEKNDEKEHKHCSKGKDYSEMKKWMEENEKDYYPVYFVEVKKYEVMD